MRTKHALTTGLLFACALSLGCESASTPRSVYSADYSPIDDSILLSYHDENHRGLYLIEESGRVIRHLVQPPAERYAFDATFSPDGKSIAFAGTKNEGKGDLFILKLESGELRTLTDSPGRDADPTFSHDGRTLYFKRAGYFGNYSPIAVPHWHEWVIMRLDLESGQESQITSGDHYEIDNLEVYPDGKRILTRFGLDEAFSIVDTEKPSEIKKLKPYLGVAWGKRRRRLPLPNGPNSPKLSPDARRVVFTITLREDLYVADLHTGRTQKLVDIGERAWAKSFSRDGSRLLFTMHPAYVDDDLVLKSDLWIFDMESKTATNIDIDFPRMDKTIPPVILFSNRSR